MSSAEEITLLLRLLAPYLAGPMLIALVVQVLWGGSWAGRINSLVVGFFGGLSLLSASAFTLELCDVIGSPNDPWDRALLLLAVICSVTGLCSSGTVRLLLKPYTTQASPAAGG